MSLFLFRYQMLGLSLGPYKTKPRQTKEQQPDEAWVCKAPEKVPGFDIKREKETFMESKRDFAAPSTSVAPAQQHQQQS